MGAKAVIMCFSLGIVEDTWGRDSGRSGGDGRAEGVRAMRRQRAPAAVALERLSEEHHSQLGPVRLPPAKERCL